MTIQQVIDLAKNGELKSLGVVDDTNAILGYLNLGLIELYKRFPLKVSEYVIDLIDGQTEYTLPGDCMWLVAAYGEVEDTEMVGTTVNVLPINTEDNPESVNMVSWNTVQVPVTTTGAKIALIYVAAPVYVTDSDLASMVAVPIQMIEPLLAYIGYKGYEAVGSDLPEDQDYYQKFETSCSRIEQRGMFTVDDLDMLARDMKGFV